MNVLSVLTIFGSLWRKLTKGKRIVLGKGDHVILDLDDLPEDDPGKDWEPKTDKAGKVVRVLLIAALASYTLACGLWLKVIEPARPASPPPVEEPEPVCTPGHGDPGEHYGCYAHPPLENRWVAVCPVLDESGGVTGTSYADTLEDCDGASQPRPDVSPPPVGETDEPVAEGCPYVIPDAVRIMAAENHNQGSDSTVKVCAGNAWCLEHSGKDQRCCPPAPEGAPYAKACAAVLLRQACPSWEYKVAGSTQWKPCLSPQNPAMSCSHFDHDDPDTPEYEGRNPECLADGDPVRTGFWTVGHGLGHVRACTADGVCSAPVARDH